MKSSDIVNHNILLQKPDQYGIEGIALNVIKTYLENCYHCVFINNSPFSIVQIVRYGVPQNKIPNKRHNTDNWLHTINSLCLVTNGSANAFQDVV